MKNIIQFIGIMLVVLSYTPVFSHGTVIYPPSRIYACFNSPSTTLCSACGGAVYDWMSVLQPDTEGGNHPAFVPDGQIASGGNARFSCLDELSTQWTTTRVNSGNIDVRWQNSAPHKTQYYKVYITPLNWDPTQPLRWNDLVEIGYMGKRDAEAFTTIRSTIPSAYKGKRAAIVSVWQRDFTQSHEAFYAVSDILVNTDGDNNDDCNSGDIVGVNFNNITNCSLQYYQDNTLEGTADAGGTYETTTTVGSQWQARQTTGEVVSDFTISCDQDTYVSAGECNEDGDNGCEGLDIWSGAIAYVGGSKVSYNGIVYESKWWTQGDDPEQNSGQYDVWKNQGACSGDGCSNGDNVSVTFINNTDCELDFYLDDYLQQTVNPGETFMVNTTIGAQWEARTNLGIQLSDFTIECNQSSYTTSGICEDTIGGDDCATAYGPYPNVYMTNDLVSYNGRNYKCLVDNLFNVAPGTASHWWEDLGTCTTSVSASEVMIYPVPVVKGLITIERNSNNSDGIDLSSKSIRILDITDGVVLNAELIENAIELDLSCLRPGIYYVFVEGEKQPKRIRIQ